MEFGITQVNKKTPAWIVISVKAISILSGVFIMWLSQTKVIHSEPLRNELYLDAGLIVTAIHLVAPLFGIKMEETKTELGNKQQ